MNKLLGILDLGSNSVMLTVGNADKTKPEQIKEFFRVTKLGDKVSETNRLNKDAIKRTIDAAVDFIDEAKAMGVERFIGTATSAVRDAENGAEFLTQVKAAVGIDPQLLSGKEEADLVFLGATADLPKGELVITADPGGGSTEINIGHVGETPFYSHSFQVGCVRQGDIFDLFETATNKQLECARSAIHNDFCTAFNQTIPEARLLISGGTSTSYSAMDQQLAEYSNKAVHHQICTLEKLDTWIEKIFTMTSNERTELPGLDPSRAPMLPTGMLIMSEIAKGFNASEFYVTTTALRHGMLLANSI